jgi:hypothetical protein
MITLPGGGGAVTVTVDDPDLLLAVAVTIVVPAATAVTRPVCDTVATDGFELAHTNVAPAGFDIAVS